MFKYINRVKVTFNPFEARSRGARAFYDSVYVDKNRHMNPDCRFEAQLMTRNLPPTIELTFVDGKNMSLDPIELSKKEMMQMINDYIDILKEPEEVVE